VAVRWDDVRAVADGDDCDQRGLVLVTLADVEPEEVEWLWHARIPRGKVTLLVGDPGGGKSYATLAIAAALSRGEALPGDPSAGIPSSVILWNGEDGLADTIRPRAEKCGADLERVHFIESSKNDAGEPVPFGLGSLRRLAFELESRPEVSLVVIDPIAALLGAVDSHRDNEIRSALQPLVEMAATYGVAIVVVMHLRKAEATRSVYRVSGSIGFVGLARSVLLVARDEGSGRHAIAQLKHNLAGAVETIPFEIDDAGFRWGAADAGLTVERLLGANGNATATSRAKQAEDEILAALGEGPMDASELERAVINAGVSPKTFERARGSLCDRGLVKRSGGGRYGPIRWSLASSLAHEPSSRSK